MQIQQAVVVVTGGASGLGLATARLALQEGARVALFDRNAEVLAVARELGAQALAAVVDVTDEESVVQALDQVLEAWGSVHALVNCAGIGAASRTVGKQGPMPLAQFAQVIQINLIGSFNMARLAAARMALNEPNAEGERGCIVHTASVAAFEGQVGQVAYSASKGGIVGMTLPMARDLAGLGIRVNTVAPGIFDTPLMQASPDDVKQPLIAMTQFPKRLGHPEEYARLVLHILQNTFMNGETVRIDGAIRMAPR
ncbi:MAG: SDR family NAD(P)-dependent oxidoreductase [Pseudomonadales bacterium]|nr:SDR family NAD(P)-dependent oxidoreductase [Pseudomonadales bacterium]